MIELAHTGRTSEKLLIDVLTARRINNILGGAFLGPWDVDGLPEDVVLQITALEGIGKLQAGFSQVEGHFEAWRRKHNYVIQ